MSSFSPALLDCSGTVAAHVHSLGTRGTYPKSRQVPSVLKQASRFLHRFATQRVRPLHVILVERAIYMQVLFFSPLPAPRRLSESLNVQECLGFFTPELYLGREGSSDPASTVRGRREGGPGGSGAGGGSPEDGAARPPPPATVPGLCGGERGDRPAATPGLTVHYFCHLASTSFQVACRCFANFAAALSPGKREREGGGGKIISYRVY